MTGSWLCLPLLLVGALLLGQPVWGQEEEEEQPSWGDEPVPEEPEEQMEPTSYEEREAMEEHWVPTSSEEREAMESFQEGEPLDLGSWAVDYFNKLPYYDGIYRSVEAKPPTFKDAIGTMVHMKMLLAKTDCRKEDLRERRDMMEHLMHFMPSSKKEPLPELKGCNLPPPDEQENLNCNFRIYMDAREGSISVVHHKCKPLRVRELW
ncbi:Hypothetical predicted protein [Podarcis lilfordi]|uniref:Uncharacterized protein n=1 Tax=Podarcis lilfordi TaxID=74358 RepID=A0AA35PTT6_9SAUR|nr:Hypothetical predicted protein [Podarcis lilfordi]